MNEPLISVIIPVYNAGKYINRCVESVINQDYYNLEIIIINDGSTDDSFDIIQKYASEDNRIVVVNKLNSGVSDTRNAGLNKASGDLIGFIDADDYIESDMYSKLVKAMAEYEADVVACGYRQEFNEYHIDLSADNNYVIEGTANILSNYLRQDIRSGIGDGNWNKLFKKSVIMDLRYPKYAYGEDILFQEKVFENCEKIAVISDILYHYVMNDSSASNAEFKESQVSVIKMAEDILGRVLVKYPEVSEEAYAFYLSWNLVLLQRIYKSSSSELGKKYRKSIISTLKRNKKSCLNNRYSKRIDQLYLKALIMGIMKQVMFLRDNFRSAVPSKDRKN